MTGQELPVDFGLSEADWPGEIQRYYPNYFRTASRDSGGWGEADANAYGAGLP